MMIKPSIEQLTEESSCNRYTLVIAAAKSARYVTAKQKLYRDTERIEKSEMKSEKQDKTDDIVIPATEKQPLRRDLYEEKPVSAGISLIHDGDFRIIKPAEIAKADGTLPE